MHRLLQRQLRRYLPAGTEIPADWLPLFEAIGDQYGDADRERNLLENAVEVSSAELNEVNQRLRAQTRDLATANVDLQTEIGERKVAEERVRVANARLEAMVHRLEEHNRQMLLLNTMGDMLQSCHSIQETYSVIADALERLFPDDHGSLALLDAADQRYHVVTAWGRSLDEIGRNFGKNDCWALRRARVHEHDCGSSSDTLCSHVPQHDTGNGCRYTCVPLANQGILLGLLFLHGMPRPTVTDGNGASPDADNDHRQLIHTAAEHMSLAIANIKLQEHLQRLSIIDPLTALYNRRHMEASLTREIARSKRSGKPCSVIMLDVDHFKQFNDRHGHPAGDTLLHELGAYLRTQVRTEDVPCRYGGEEFILVLPGAGPEDTARRAEQIRAGIEAGLRVSYGGRRLPQVTASLGIASFPTHAATAESVVLAADQALYRAKVEGRNRVNIAAGPPRDTPPADR